MSTSLHLQIDGSTEIMNRMIGNYLRCYCAFHQTDWDILLRSAEFADNAARVESTKISPFELEIGQQPKSPLELLAQGPKVDIQSVSEFKESLRASFTDATFAHRLAQTRQAAYNSKLYAPPTQTVGDEVFLSKKLFTDAS